MKSQKHKKGVSTPYLGAELDKTSKQYKEDTHTVLCYISKDTLRLSVVEMPGLRKYLNEVNLRDAVPGRCHRLPKVYMISRESNGAVIKTKS